MAIGVIGPACAAQAPGAAVSSQAWLCPVSRGVVDPGMVPPIAPSAPITYVTHTDPNSGVSTNYQFTLSLPPPIPGFKPPRPVPPVVIIVHGGGWATGYPLTNEAAYFASLGYAAVPIQYRLITDQDKHLIPANVFPAGLQDVRCAIRFVRANAASLGVDGTRIAVFGESAGGNLAAMAGATPDLDPPLDSADCPAVAPGAANPHNLPVASATPQFVIDLYGVNNLSNSNTYTPTSTTGPYWQQGINIAKNLFELFQIAIPDGSDPPITYYNLKYANVVPAMAYFAADASAEFAYPDTQFTLNEGAPGYSLPPFFIQNGASDQVVPPNQSLTFFNEITASANPSNLPNGVPYANAYANQQISLAETASIHQQTAAQATYTLLPGVDHGYDPFMFTRTMVFNGHRYSLAAEINGVSELSIAQQSTCAFVDQLGAVFDWYRP